MLRGKLSIFRYISPTGVQRYAAVAYLVPYDWGRSSDFRLVKYLGYNFERCIPFLLQYL